MVTSIVTLLAIGIAAGAGMHRNRFRPVRRARQQPPERWALLHQPGQ